MAAHPLNIYHFTLNAMLVGWFGFAAAFLLRKKPPRGTVSRRDPMSLLGLFLQVCAYAIVWLRFARLREPAAILPSVPAELARSAVVIALLIGSVWLVGAAVVTLGEQWALSARLIEGHHLITAGPYRFIRNPIYTGMLGMLLATGLAFGYWIQIVIGIVLFWIGLVIRVRSEEKLLRSAFGKEFEEYARRVPAVVPGIY
jgi:protein-S-isoprenylcysteine O-methyltransferase Ste14